MSAELVYECRPLDFEPGPREYLAHHPVEGAVLLAHMSGHLLPAVGARVVDHFLEVGRPVGLGPVGEDHVGEVQPALFTQEAPQAGERDELPGVGEMVQSRLGDYGRQGLTLVPIGEEAGLPEDDVADPLVLRSPGGVLEHGRRHVDGDHLTALPGSLPSEDARAGADLQDDIIGGERQAIEDALSFGSDVPERGHALVVALDLGEVAVVPAPLHRLVPLPDGCHCVPPEVAS